MWAQLFVKATTTEKSHIRNLNHWRDLFSFKNSYSQLCIDTNGASQGTNLIQSTCDERQDDQNFQCDLAVRSIKRRRADQCWTLGELASSSWWVDYVACSIGFIPKMADSFPSILLFCQSFSISRLIKGLVRISGRRHARVSNDLTLRWIRYPRKGIPLQLYKAGGGEGWWILSLAFFDMSQYFEKILPPVESFSSSRQEEVIISWVVALLETCNVTNMAAILDLTRS